MNKLSATIIAATAAATMAAIPTAARTVSVVSIGETTAQIAFGDADGKAYKLAVCYGDEDGGATTNMWDSFEVLGNVAAADTSRTVALPAGWGSTVTHLRYFLLMPEIPDGATRVEYLQSNGSQYINTQVRGKVGVEAEIDVAAVSMGDKTILGCRKDSGDTRFFPVHWANNRWWKGWLRNDGDPASYWCKKSSDVDIVVGTRYHVRAVLKNGEQAFYVDGEVKGTPMSEVSDFDSGLDMYLFAANQYGSGYFQTASAKIYAAKIWLDGNLKREFVPCLDTNDKPAMYDRVSGGYFYNGGTGADFSTPGTALPTALFVETSSTTAAAADYGMPDAFLDYIQSSGAQYIDTEVNAETGLKAIADFSWVGTITTSTDWAILGARDGKANPNSSRFLMVHMYNQKPFVGYGKDSRGNTGGAVAFTSGARSEIVADFSDSSALELYQNGTATFSASDLSTYSAHGDIDLGYNLYVFAVNNGLDPQQKSSAKLYGLDILRKNGSGGFDAVRRYLPAMKKGVVGLYDAVSGKFFGSATSTAFLCGNITNEVNVTPPTVRYAYVEADGVDDYISLGVNGDDGIRMFADMEWVAIPKDGVFCGARKNSGNFRFFPYSSYEGMQRFGYGTGSPTVQDGSGVGVQQSTGVRYRVTAQLDAGAQTSSIQKFDNGEWVFDSSRSLSEAGPVVNGIPLFLFARNYGGTADCFCAARVYSLKLWQKDGNGDHQLVRDFVPAKTIYDEVALWDRVSETWFRNCGTGALSHGAERPWEDGVVIRFW